MSLIKAATGNKPASTVLGVDASTHSFAFCLMDTNGPLKWGEINFKGGTVFERLAFAGKSIQALRDEFEVDLVLIESSVYVNNKATVIAMAYFVGAILGALRPRRVEEAKPLEWQNAIGNRPLTTEEKKAIQSDFPGKSKSWYTNKYREARKQRTIEWVKLEYDVVISSDNVADAFGLARFGIDKYGQKEKASAS